MNNHAYKRQLILGQIRIYIAIYIAIYVAIYCATVLHDLLVEGDGYLDESALDIKGFLAIGGDDLDGAMAGVLRRIFAKVKRAPTEPNRSKPLIFSLF